MFLKQIENLELHWPEIDLSSSRRVSNLFRLLFLCKATAVQEQEADSEPKETKQVEKSMQSQMLCELQRVKKEMLGNSQLVSKPEV